MLGTVSQKKELYCNEKTFLGSDFVYLKNEGLSKWQTLQQILPSEKLDTSLKPPISYPGLPECFKKSFAPGN